LIGFGFRGTLRWLANTKGMMSWLWNRQVLLKDFKPHAIALTGSDRRESRRIAQSSDKTKNLSAKFEHVERRRRQKTGRPSGGFAKGWCASSSCVEPADLQG